MPAKKKKVETRPERPSRAPTHPRTLTVYCSQAMFALLEELRAKLQARSTDGRVVTRTGVVLAALQVLAQTVLSDVPNGGSET